MYISVKGEYALQAVFDLTLQAPSRQPVKIAGIAQRQKIPQKFLELILASLKQGGFVESRRGADGGYLLARPPESIKVGEVLRFVEGARDENARAPELRFPISRIVGPRERRYLGSAGSNFVRRPAPHLDGQAL